MMICKFKEYISKLEELYNKEILPDELDKYKVFV